MNSLIIGYGSIGSRHAKILTDLGNRVAILSKRQIDYPQVYNSIANALNDFKPEYIIVANETSKHLDTLLELTQHSFSGIVLVEKPLFDSFNAVKQINALSQFSMTKFKHLFVAYNLRFHPIIQKLKSVLINEKVISLSIYVGQYLPDWRPNTDYRQQYSAKKELGGGVLRDLSHELDYLYWLFGDWVRLIALGGHYSNLEITSDDIFNIMIEMKDIPIVNLQMNYLDRFSRREIIINTDSHTYKADLVNNQLYIDKQQYCFPNNRDLTYKLMHESILAKNFADICSLDDGIKIMKIIEAAEQSVKQGKWIYNEKAVYH